jgi:hypothetical protein
VKRSSFTVTRARGQFTPRRQLKCSLCGSPIPTGPGGWRHGHNAQPLSGGRCCEQCNSDVVVPARIAQLKADARKMAGKALASMS